MTCLAFSYLAFTKIVNIVKKYYRKKNSGSTAI